MPKSLKRSESTVLLDVPTPDGTSDAGPLPQVEKSAAERRDAVEAKLVRERERVSALEEQLAQETEASAERRRQVALGTLDDPTPEERTAEIARLHDLERDVQDARHGLVVLCDAQRQLQKEAHAADFEAILGQIRDFCETGAAERARKMMADALVVVQSAGQARGAARTEYARLMEKLAIAAVGAGLIAAGQSVGGVVPIELDMPREIGYAAFEHCIAALLHPDLGDHEGVL